MSGPKKRAMQAPDRRGGTYLLLPSELLKSTAYRSLSLRARATLIEMHHRFNGFNNGSIGLSARALAEALGSKSHKQNLRAIDELIERGIIKLSKDYPKVQRMAREYTLTYISTGREPYVAAATNDYVSWVEEKSPVRTVLTARPFPVSTVRTGPKHAVRTERTDAAKMAKLTDVSVSTVPTHIYHHVRASDPSPVNASETARRHFRDEPVKPDSMTTERWEQALRAARENSAAPEPEWLRDRVTTLIEEMGRGSQSRIASAAGVPPSTFSKFVNGTLDLDGLGRVRIAEALLRIAA